MITRGLAGIRPVEPGFKRFTVDPRPGLLEFFKVRQPTVHGAVELEWQKSSVLLTVPRGTEAVYRNKVYTSGTHHF